MRIWITCLLLLGALGMQGQGIEFFHGTWEEALSKAEAEDKIIFVDAFAEWCGPCKRMSAQVFPQESVGAFYNKHFVNIKYDVEKGDGLTFRQKYPVSSFPTFFFIDYNGEVVHRTKGALQADNFISLGKAAYGKVDRSEKYVADYESGDRSPELVYNYIKALNRAGKPSLKVANDYLKKSTDYNNPMNLKILFEATTKADSRLFDLFTGHMDNLKQHYSARELEERICDACESTLTTAIEFKSEDLYQEAVTKAKAHAGKEGSDFKTLADQQYGLATKNSKLYLKAVNTKLSKDPDNELLMLKKVIGEITDTFDKDVKALKMAQKYAQKLVSFDDNYVHLYILSEVLFKSGEYNKALETAHQSLEKATSNKSNTQKIEVLIKKIEERS